MIGKRGGRELEHGLQIGYQFNIIVNIIPNLLDIPTGSAFIGTRERERTGMCITYMGTGLQATCLSKWTGSYGISTVT